MELSKLIHEIIKQSSTPITNSTIRAILNSVNGIYPDARTIRNEITNLRLCEGIPICANTQGYFIPDSIGNYTESILRLQRQIETLKATSKVLSDGLYKEFGVIPIFTPEGIETVSPNALKPPFENEKDLRMLKPENFEEFFNHCDNEKQLK